ncbi:Helix-turn-helix domain [Mycobacteroides abscessus]|nr:Helix-turn-helix domain [Mycobacteroides abscessus]
MQCHSLALPACKKSRSVRSVSHVTRALQLVHIYVYGRVEFRWSSECVSSGSGDEGPDLRPLGIEIQRLRIAKGYSLTDLVSHTGIAKYSLHRYENMKSVPTIRALVKIAHGLGVPVSQLVAVLDELPARDRGDRAI